MEELHEITLESLDGGGALELWQDRFSELLRNVADANTDAEAAREITLKVKVAPHKSREVGEITYAITLKTAGPKPVSSTVYFGKTRDGRIVAQGKDPRQGDLLQEGKEPSVHPLTARTAEAR